MGALEERVLHASTLLHGGGPHIYKTHPMWDGGCIHWIHNRFFFHIREEASMEIFSGVAQTLVVRTLIVITRFLEEARREPNFLECSNEKVKELDDGTN